MAKPIEVARFGTDPVLIVAGQLIRRTKGRMKNADYRRTFEAWRKTTRNDATATTTNTITVWYPSIRASVVDYHFRGF